MINLEVGCWYSVWHEKTKDLLDSQIKWYYCGETSLGHLFQRFCVDYIIPSEEINEFTFYKAFINNGEI